MVSFVFIKESGSVWLPHVEDHEAHAEELLSHPLTVNEVPQPALHFLATPVPQALSPLFK